MSTAECQDEASSRAWQLESAADLVAGRGVIVAEYFDVGCSRRLPWSQRPQAAALLGAIADPDRGFDAVMVGEFERAFAGDQLMQLLPLLDRCGVQVWLPEAGGPLDLDDPTHRAWILLLAHQSRREILRSRFRTTAAMRAQARDQGQHLGGRPPYGYRLVDAGPHPNAAHAAWGRRLHRLDPDPRTAPYVRWIFVQRLAGHSMAGIARTLNALADRRSGERTTLFRFRIRAITFGYMSAVKCPECGGPLSARKRRHAVYCSSRCRTRAFRRRCAAVATASPGFVVRCRGCEQTWDCEDRDPSAQFCSARCRARYWRGRVRAAAADAGQRMRNANGKG